MFLRSNKAGRRPWCLWRRGLMEAAAGAGLAPRATKERRYVYMDKNNTSQISRPMTIRVKNEVWEYFRGKPLNRMVESLYRYIENEQIEEDGGEIVVKGAFMVDKGVVHDLELMCELYGITFDKMFIELHRALDEGEIDIKDGRFVYPVKGYDVKRGTIWEGKEEENGSTNRVNPS